MKTGIKALGLGIGFMALVFTASSTIKAEEGVGVGVHIGGGHSDRGHYEERTENVLVAPARVEHRLIPASFQNQVQADGTTVQVQVSPAHYEDVTVPEVYEARTTKVWVEDREPGLHLGVGIHL